MSDAANAMLLVAAANWSQRFPKYKFMVRGEAIDIRNASGQLVFKVLRGVGWALYPATGGALTDEAGVPTSLDLTPYLK